MVKVAILGVGSRGAETYGNYLNSLPEKATITAICDIDPHKINHYKKLYNLSDECCFSSADELFAKGKLADVLIIATLDKDHYRQAQTALDIGYNLLLEKPISPSINECVEIEKKAAEKNLEVVVCHVLRYTPFYRKIKEIIQSGKLGKITNVSSIENVGYWHMAHSFVRGNWNNSIETAPMILSKCCHDIDILNWLIDKKPISVSSYGSLDYFKKENAPVGNSSYCYNCKVKETCPYNAISYYVDSIKDESNLGWPYDVVVLNPTKEKLLEALKNGKYGRCVFECDNDVVDHQILNILYEDNVIANHTMCAFSRECYRELRVYGTLGDLIANSNDSIITYHEFLGNKEYVIDATKLSDDYSGHLGGDKVMINELLSLIENKKANIDSSIEKSVLSHIICLASEKSRLNGGKVINIEQFKNKN